MPEASGACRLIYFFKNHILDADRRELRRDTTLIPVEPQVFDLILYLVRNRDRVVSKDDLIDAVWGGRIVSESALTTRINAARTAIGDSGKAQHFIRTLPRKGVRFIGEVRETPADPAQPSAASRSELPVVVRAEARAFSVLMGEDEDATRSALRSSRALVVTNLEARRGRILSTPADTVIAVFTDATKGVSAAADARDALAGLNRNLSTESRVHYRFGIASGELNEGTDGPGGQAVGRAATLGLRAPSGAVRLSESVLAALADDPAFATVKVEAGDYELATGNTSAPVKGLPTQLESLDPPLPGLPSIVILPFKAIGDDPSESEAFADGLRIEVQNAFTKMSGVFLLGVGSALAMRGWSALDAATRTGVRYVLEGTVQRSGDQLRVSVQLTDTIAGAVVLSESYDRVLDRNFALQDEITTCIVTALDVKLLSGEQARIWHKGLTDPTARERFYRGIQTFFRMNAESMVYARDCFTLVSELAPASPLGPTWMALCLWFESTRGWAADPVHAREQAGVWAERAAAMEDTDGQAHTVLGNVRLLQRRFDEALAIASEAITIRPGCTNANGFLANVLLYCGEPQKAISHARRAIRYMPVYPPWFVEILAAAYRDAGLLDLAIIAAREVARIAPSAIQGRLVLTSALVRSNWLADARRVVSDSRMLDANLSLTRWAASQPYRNTGVLADIIDDLRKSGVPD
jgi:adenylate cyclase